MPPHLEWINGYLSWISSMYLTKEEAESITWSLYVLVEAPDGPVRFEIGKTAY